MLSLILLVLPVLNHADENAWIGDLEKNGHLGVRYGFHDDDASSYALNATVPLIYYSELSLVFSEYQQERRTNETQSDEQWGIYWNSDILQTYAFGLGYEKSGSNSSVTSDDIHIFIQYATEDNWSFRAKYLQGDIALNYGSLRVNIEEQFRALGLLSRERQGFGLSVNYDKSGWGTRLSVNYYDYDGDKAPRGAEFSALNQVLLEESTVEARFWLSVYYGLLYQAQRDRGNEPDTAIANINAFFERFEQEILMGVEEWVARRAREKRSQNALYYRYAYGEQNLLSQQDISLDVYWSAGKNTYTMGVLSYESYIDETFSTQVYISLESSIRDRYSLGTLVSYSDENDSAYAELSMGISW